MLRVSYLSKILSYWILPNRICNFHNTKNTKTHCRKFWGKGTIPLPLRVGDFLVTRCVKKVTGEKWWRQSTPCHCSSLILTRSRTPWSRVGYKIFIQGFHQNSPWIIEFDWIWRKDGKNSLARILLRFRKKPWANFQLLHLYLRNADQSNSTVEVCRGSIHPSSMIRWIERFIIPKSYLSIWVFPKIGVSPKWMVYNGKTLLKWMIWGYHYFRKHPYVALESAIYKMSWSDIQQTVTNSWRLDAPDAGIQMQVKFTSADTVTRLLLVEGGFCFVCVESTSSIYGELM